jgi:hypothetical protein
MATGVELPRITLVRMGRNDAVARGPRDRHRTDGSRDLVRLECECDAPRCLETFVLDAGDYFRVRAHHGWLLVSPGHQAAGTVVDHRLHACFVVRAAGVS